MFTLKSDGLLILKQQEFASDEELLSFARRFSSKRGSLKEEILHWDFGPVMKMEFDPNAKNYLFSKEEVPFHWDGAFHQEPRYLLFFCTHSEGKGGETLFVNTERIWEKMDPIQRREAKKAVLTYQTQKFAHYGGMIRVPLVQTHPVSGKTILRMAEAVETKLNPVSLKIEGVDNPQDFYAMMKTYLYEEAYAHRWEKGDLILCDNFTFLHGRRSLNQNLKRQFNRVQIL